MQSRINDTHYLRIAINTLRASWFELYRVKKFGKYQATVNAETITFDLYEYKGKDYMFNVIGDIT